MIAEFKVPDGWRELGGQEKARKGDRIVAENSSGWQIEFEWILVNSDFLGQTPREFKYNVVIRPKEVTRARTRR